MHRQKHSLVKNIDGASAIEFAIVMPVFLLLLLGIICYGLYFGAAHSTAQLAADAARASVAGLNDIERVRLAHEHVAKNASEYILITPEKISVEAAPLNTDPTQFRVAVRYDAAALPIWHLATLLPLPSTTIERTAVIKRGGY